jgi:Transglycosylase SLT domain
MMRFAGLSIVFILAASATQTGAQPQANAPATQNRSVPTENSSERPATAQPPTVDDICRALEEDAAENELPVEFFARVIWQESRFNARAVSRAGAQGIAQFMPRTADWRGLADPFDPIGALRHSASYLRDLRNRFGNLGLAAAGYNAGPGRVSEWLAGRRSLPSETRNYVATVTGWTADEWASSSPPETAETTIPQGLPCTRLANLILAPKEEAQRIAGYVPRWGAQLTSNWSESRAWATYRALQKQYASLIGDREPIVLHGRLPGMGSATRTIIRIGDDNRAYLEKLCAKLIAAGGACVVLRNSLGRG